MILSQNMVYAVDLTGKYIYVKETQFGGTIYCVCVRDNVSNGRDLEFGEYSTFEKAQEALKRVLQFECSYKRNNNNVTNIDGRWYFQMPAEDEV